VCLCVCVRVHKVSFFFFLLLKLISRRYFFFITKISQFNIINFFNLPLARVCVVSFFLVLKFIPSHYLKNICKMFPI